MPEASTRMSTPPKRFTAASTILSQFAAELGRMLTVSTLAPRFSQSAATFFSASAPPAASTTLQPAPESTCAASAPNAPVAPVTMAILPLTSNRESGFFRKSSDMVISQRHGLFPSPACGGGWGGGLRPRRLPRWLRLAPSGIASLAASPASGGGIISSLHRRHGHRNRADLIAAVDDLAAFVRADVDAVAGLGHRLLAAGDHRELAR